MVKKHQNPVISVINTNIRTSIENNNQVLHQNVNIQTTEKIYNDELTLLS